MTLHTVSTCLLLLILLVRAEAVDDYVDPNDMLNFDSANVKMRQKEPAKEKYDHINLSIKGKEKPNTRTGTEEVSNEGEGDSYVNWKHSQEREGLLALQGQCAALKETSDSATTLLRQYVLTLVQHVERKIGPESSPVELNLRVQLSYHDVSKLRIYGTEGTKDFHDMFEVLRNMVLFADNPLPKMTTLYWLEAKLGISTTVLLYILSILLTILVMMKMLISLEITWRLLFRFLFITFFVSVAFTWLEMYQKQLAENEKILMNQMKDSCPNVKDMNWLSRLSSWLVSTVTFQDDECREFYRAMLVNPMVKVSPIEAVAVAVVKSIFTPMEIVGTGIKAFLSGLLRGLPTQYQIYVTTVLAFLVIITPFLCMGYRVNIFHLIDIGPGPRHAQHIGYEPAPPPPYLENRGDQQQRQVTNRPLTQPLERQPQRSISDSHTSSLSRSAVEAHRPVESLSHVRSRSNRTSEHQVQPDTTQGAAAESCRDVLADGDFVCDSTTQSGGATGGAKKNDYSFECEKISEQLSEVDISSSGDMESVRKSVQKLHITDPSDPIKGSVEVNENSKAKTNSEDFNVQNDASFKSEVKPSGKDFNIDSETERGMSSTQPKTDTQVKDVPTSTTPKKVTVQSKTKPEESLSAEHLIAPVNPVEGKNKLSDDALSECEERKQKSVC